MQTSLNIDVGIREIRQLTSFIRDKHGVDYSDYALTSLKRRVENLLINSKLDVDTLLKKLESKEFLDQFNRRISVSDTEMFRDPTFWILLKNNYITNILKEYSKTRIWMPLCASGEEYYSLAILLKESGWTNSTEVYVSSMSNETLQVIQSGWMENEKLEISAKNYSRFHGGAGQLTDYFKKNGNDIAFDTSLFSNTQFLLGSHSFDRELPHMHLILFRNKMIYFNPGLQYRFCDILHSKLAARGLLALGRLEEIDQNNAKFTVLNRDESIYQRKS